MPAIRGSDSKSKTRRRKRDLDQVYDDLRSPKHLAQYKETKAVEDLPALGEHYCIECAKWFEAEHNLVQHRRGKPHKRRLRQLREQPYTQKEAEAAIGLTTDNRRPDAMAVDEPTQEAEKTEPISAAKHEDDHEEYDAFFKTY